MQVQTKVMKINLLYVFVGKEGIALQYLFNGNYLLSDNNCKDKAQISTLTLSTNISVTCLTSEYLALDYVFCGQNKIQSMKYDLVNMYKKMQVQNDQIFLIQEVCSTSDYHADYCNNLHKL